MPRAEKHWRARRAAVSAVALVLAGCLRSGPSLGGKFCTPGSGASECGDGFTCGTQSPTGEALALPSPGGICIAEPVDCDVQAITCPQDAGFWICAPRLDASASCFAEGAPQLGGSVCMQGVAACRQYGVFQWNADGGECVLPPGFDGSALARPECADAGGAGPLCLCDFVDEDCSGAADDFPALPPLAGSPALFFGSGCAPDGGPALVLEPSGRDGGFAAGSVSVDSCAAFSLGHAFSIAEVDVSEQSVIAGTCGASASGAAAALRLFAPLDDGGVQDFGLATLSGGKVAFDVGGERLRGFTFCLPPNPDAPFGIAGVSLRRELAAGHCDLP